MIYSKYYTAEAISREQAKRYEDASTSLIMSIIYIFIPKLFERKCKKKYDRYVQYLTIHEKVTFEKQSDLN